MTPNKKPLPAISFSTAAFGAHDMSSFFDDLAGLGVHGVEISFILNYPGLSAEQYSRANVDRVAAILEAGGLSCTSVVAQLPIDAASQDSGALASRLARRIEFCAGLGSPFMVVNAPPSAGLAQFLDALDKARSLTGAASPMVLLENPGHGPATFLDVADKTPLGDLDAVGAAINFDICNYFTQGGSLSRLAAFVAPMTGRIRQIHAKDVRRTGDWLDYCALGSGYIPLASTLRMTGLGGLPIVAELPLFLRRKADGAPEPGPFPSLAQIRADISASLDALLRAVP